ncbi:methyl-accepting chemotaxis protein [Dyella sp.]|uniref:methyl-accepting chemotaxis protein n=1 Tax=Dyella sp. TaxID=1869338 RepID=UPI002ED3624E
MRFTVKLKIIAAMCAALAITLIVGVIGLVALSRTFDDLEALYHTELNPIVYVTSVRSDIAKMRMLLDDAQALGLDQAALARLNERLKKADDTWERYYPSLVTSEDELAAAKEFVAARQPLTSMLSQLGTLVASGQKDQARALAQQKIVPLLDRASDPINHIIQANEAEAETQFQQAGHRHHVVQVVAAATIACGFVVMLLAAYLLIRAVVAPLTKASGLAREVSQGRLGNALSVTGNDELSDMLHALSAMDAKLVDIVATVRDNADQVSLAAQHISQGNDDLSQRTQEQASSLEETAASMEEMSASIRQNADGASAARQLAGSLRGQARDGAGVAKEAMGAMEEIVAASGSIADIAVLIDEIAFQTNLLALNAAVEAARAGEQGRGFAVVASEVRSLAHRSATAAREIKQTISHAGERVSVGAVLVERTSGALEAIEQGAIRVADIVAEIAAATTEQSSGVDQVTKAVTTLDEVTQQNAALVEEASAASRNCMDLAQELVGQVAFFTLAGQSEDVSKGKTKPVAAPSLLQGGMRASSPISMRTAPVETTWNEF